MDHDSKVFLLDGMTWSFSRLNSYDTCPRAFFLEYLECKEKSGNAFSEWGSLCHSLFERYYKGELECYQLLDAYVEEYDDAIKNKFPFPKMSTSYYHNGVEFFEQFEGDYEGYDVVGVEMPVRTKIAGRNFIGYIDLLLKKDDEYYIVDFKSKSKFESEEEKKHYAIQLYLYAQFVKDKFGKYPIGMEFNMFRARTKVKIQFTQEDMQFTMDWFTSTLKHIYDDEVFVEKPDEFFCKQLCSVSRFCKYGNAKDKDVKSNADRRCAYRKGKKYAWSR